MRVRRVVRRVLRPAAPRRRAGDDRRGADAVALRGVRRRRPRLRLPHLAPADPARRPLPRPGADLDRARDRRRGRGLGGVRRVVLARWPAPASSTSAAASSSAAAGGSTSTETSSDGHDPGAASRGRPCPGRVLAEQQASSRYPVRWPLPIPIEDFLVRPGEERAWVAEVDGAVVGHVAVYGVDGPLRDAFVAAPALTSWPSWPSSSSGSDVVGTGVGGRLHRHRRRLDPRLRPPAGPRRRAGPRPGRRGLPSVAVGRSSARSSRHTWARTSPT